MNHDEMCQHLRDTLIARLRDTDEEHCSLEPYSAYLLCQEAADALASLTKEMEGFRAMFALIPDNYRSDGDTSFWIGEYDPVHKTTGRSMTPEEREQRSTVAHKVLGCAIALRSSGISSAQSEQE